MNANPLTNDPSKPDRDVARPSRPPHDVEWLAGDLPCGILVLELQSRMAALEPGQILRLKTEDPGARKDIPAWCNLTENVLLKGEHPWYWIRRKEG